MEKATKKKIKIILAYMIITLIGFVILYDIFIPGLMTYSDHLPHYMEAHYLKYNLLANNEVSGWYPYVFAGIPLYTYIPILGHYLLILLSLIFGMELAYKLILLLSFIGPSLAIFHFLQSRFKFIPSLLISIPLMFIDSWQGAILTGLWATGIALSLLIIFIDLSFKFEKINLKKSIILSIIFALIILAHTIIGLVTLIFIFCRILSNYKDYRRLIPYYFLIIIVGIFLVAYYILPIIDTSQWSDTPRNTLIGYGNSLKEIVITEVGQLFNLKPHLLPVKEIFSSNFKNGFIDLFSSIFKNILVLILDILAIIGIFLIVKNKKYEDIEIRTLTLLFFSLIFLASNIWLLIPQLQKIKILNTFAVYPARLIFTARILLPIFAIISLNELKIKSKNIWKVLIVLLLLIPLLTLPLQIPSSNLTQTTSNSLTYNEAVETMKWINQTVNSKETRVFDQNTYGNSEIERKNIMFAISPLYTETQFLTSWITRVYHTEEFLTSETGVIGNKKIEEISLEELKNFLETYNAKYIITSDTKLKNKLSNTNYFTLRKEGKLFSVFMLNNYNPSWIKSSKGTTYSLINFNNKNMEFNITSLKQEDIEIKVSYHPYWRAKVNDKEIKLYETKNALMGLSIPSGKSNLKLEFITIPEIFTAISTLAIIIVIILLIILCWSEAHHSKY